MTVALCPAVTVNAFLSKATDVVVAVSMAKSGLNELPPPGGGLFTNSVAVPALAKSAAGIAAVICVELTNVVGFAVPLKKATAPLTKLEPLIVKVNAPEFCFAETGANDVMSGAGLPTDTVFGADWLLRKN